MEKKSYIVPCIKLHRMKFIHSLCLGSVGGSTDDAVKSSISIEDEYDAWNIWDVKL